LTAAAAAASVTAAAAIAAAAATAAVAAATAAAAGAGASAEEWRHLAGLHQDDLGTLALLLGALALAPATEVRQSFHTV
jgi:hypothetical protein